MNRIIIALLAFLTLIGCRTRKEVTNTEQKQVQKERIIKYKDSTQLFAHNSHSSQYSHSSQENFELELETLTDTLGNPRELIYTRIRDGDNETIRVSGGKVKITTKSNLSNSQIVANTTLDNITKANTYFIAQRHSETAFSHKTKNVKSSYLYLIAIIVVLLIAFYFIRNKLKRFLK
nr:MAG TPA: Protein involved in gliding motility 9 Secretion System Type.5A [Caudoviricetes sp.]